MKDGKIVGVHRGAPRKIKISEEQIVGGKTVLPKLEDYPPMFTPLTAARTTLIDQMMRNSYNAAEVMAIVIPASARSSYDNVALYDDGLYIFS